MREATDSEFSPPTSPVKSALVVVGALAGLLLLICGGAAGYVALVSPPRDEKPTSNATKNPSFSPESLEKIHQERAARQISLTDDPTSVRKIAARICQLDLPAGFEPFEAVDGGVTRRAVFGKGTTGSALLKVAQVDWPMGNRLTEMDSFTERQVIDMADHGIGRIDSTLKVTREKKKPLRRELTVLGQKVQFVFQQGKRASDNKPVWKVKGAFCAAQGGVGLVLMVPESDFDEEAIARMIESIRSAEGEQADAAPESHAAPAQSPKSDAPPDSDINSR